MSQPSRRRAVSNYETTAQKVSGLAGPRVNKVLNALENIGNLGPLIHQYSKENDVDVNQLITNLLDPIREAMSRTQIRLQTAKARDRREKNEGIENRPPVRKAIENSQRATAHVKKAHNKKKVPDPQTTRPRANSEPGEWKKPWNEVSGGSFGLGKSRKH